MSNTRNAILQMTKWLDRQEKIEMFGRYVNDQAEENQDPLTRTIMLAKQPAVHAQPISKIEELHSAPYFSRDLKCFLNSLLSQGQSILHSQLQHASLGLGLECLDV